MKVILTIAGSTVSAVMRDESTYYYCLPDVLKAVGIRTKPSIFIANNEYLRKTFLVARQDSFVAGSEQRFLTWEGVLYVASRGVVANQPSRAALSFMRALTGCVELEIVRKFGDFQASSSAVQTRAMGNPSELLAERSPVLLSTPSAAAAAGSSFSPESRISISAMTSYSGQKRPYFDCGRSENDVKDVEMIGNAPISLSSASANSSSTETPRRGFLAVGGNLAEYGVPSKKRLVVTQEDLTVLVQAAQGLCKKSGHKTTIKSVACEGLSGTVTLKCDTCHFGRDVPMSKPILKGGRLEVNMSYLVGEMIFSDHPAAMERVLRTIGLQVPNKSKIETLRSLVETALKKICVDDMNEKLKPYVQDRRKTLQVAFDGQWSREARMKTGHAQFSVVTFVDLTDGSIVHVEIVNDSVEVPKAETLEGDITNKEHTAVKRALTFENDIGSCWS